jgi:murein DD-endopeptidase MepM/ murein hydrolase activator NlpD
MRNVATTRILFERERAPSTAAEKGWLWPLPRLDGVAPCITAPAELTPSDGFVGLGYPDRVSSPELVPVFAPQDGAITYATRSQRGGTVCLDHPGGWSTVLSGLETVLADSTDRFSRRRKSRVRAGDVLGYVRNTLHVSFGLSRWLQGEWTTIDPATCCHAWTVQPWFTKPTSDVPSGLAL